MDITPTITPWAPTTAATARRAIREPRIARMPRARVPLPGSAASVPPTARGATAARSRDSSNGSGRSPVKSSTVASSRPAPEITNGPDMGGNPKACPTAVPGWMRFGPATAPTVTAHTTVERARPRCSGAARSTAANRACRLAAVPTPIPAAPSTRRMKTPDTTESTIRTVPARAADSPATWPIRRPRRSARPARGNAANAAPRVITVATAPAHALEPDSSTARIEPMETVAPVPMPPNTCAALSSATVRRCTRRTPASVMGVPAMVRA